MSSLCALCVLQLILMCVVPTFKMCDIFFLFFLNGVRSRTLPILCMGSVENIIEKIKLAKDSENTVEGYISKDTNFI